MTFKAIHGLSLQYIVDLITIKQPNKYSLRSQNSIVLVPPKGKILATLGDRSFSAAVHILSRRLRHFFLKTHLERILIIDLYS